MTLMLITTSRDRAFVAADTAGYYTATGEADVAHWPGGQPLNVCKPRAFPNIGCVVMAAGRIGEHARQVVDGAASLEHAVELLQAHLPQFPQPAGTYRGKPLGQVVYLVGWSAEHSCMVHVGFSGEDGYRPSWSVPAPGGAVCAFVPHAEFARVPQSIDEVATVARRAVERAREEDPRAPFGGRLIVGELTRESITLRDCGGLGMPLRRPNAPDIVRPPWQYAPAPVPQVSQILAGFITTTHIAGGAAATVQSTEFGAGSHAWVALGAGVGAAGFYGSTIATLSYTNSTGRDVNLELTAALQAYSSGGGANGRPILKSEWTQTSPAGGGGRNCFVTNTAEASFAFNHHITVPDGATVTWNMKGGGERFATNAMPAGETFWDQGAMRLTVVKA